MSKEIYISSTPHETRLAIVENDDLTEIYYERENEYTLAGSIYNGRVTRVLPGMQSSFVDVGLERDAFLYITDFMEEAGDSAEFDSGDGRVRARAEHRGDSRPDARGDSRTDARGSDRNRDETAPAADSPRAPQEASESGERTERGGRRRRGGHRDNRGAAPVSQENARPEAGLGAGGEVRDSGDFPAVAPPVLNSNLDGGAEQEIGEGAPGADGSRRWRGRRGRRRGRGNGPRETALPYETALQGSAPASGGAAETDVAEALALGPDPSAGYDLPDLADSGEGFELDAAATPEFDVTSPESSILEMYTRPARSSRPDSFADDRGPRPSGDRGRRDRGGREDRGSRGGRDRDGGREDHGTRTPRGFEPTSAGYVADAEDSGPAPEPIVLPGESLAKYRAEESASPQAAQSTASRVTSQSAAEFSLPGTWDGGSVLPGETLRPRTVSSQTPRGEGRRESDRRPDRRPEGRGEGRGERRRGGRDGGREPQAASFAAAPVTPLRMDAAPAAHDAGEPAVPTPPSAEARLPETSPVLPPHESPYFEPASAAAEQGTPERNAAPQDHSLSSVSPHAEPEGDYEPTEASASYRVDPAPPQEFRQPSPEPAVLTPPVDALFEAAALHAAHSSAPQASAAEPLAPVPPIDHSFFGDTVSGAHSITPPPGVPLAPLTSDSLPSPLMAPETLSTSGEGTATAHDLTAITGEGDMLSHAPVPPPPEEPAVALSPIEHETAVVEHDHPSTLTELSASSESSASDSSAAYEPGSADIAGAPEVFTEEIEDEDFHTTTLHAASIEEIDPDEEIETLDGAADLGTMLREMSIDELTRVHEDQEGESEDDDEEFAFEEEDSLEDPQIVNGFTETARAVHTPEFTDGDEEGFADADESRADETLHAAEGNGSTHTSEEGSADRRRGGRRDNRRGAGRDRDRNGGRDRARSTGGSSSGFQPGRRDHRHSAQTTDLPAISDLLKPGQELLVQIAKEPIAKKGARITSHIALPGRFLVFMPTVSHTGVSRKIESDGERRRLKEILLSEKGEASGGFIVRTAAAGASEEELRSDLRFLLNLWADIKQRSESSKSPALIYHDLNLVERVLRDQVTDNFSAIWVDSETEYERVLRFLQRFQPSLIRRVKLYTKDTPMYEQFGITEEINKALRSKVWLKSGGSIVINQTEALVAIDINTGKYVGKTARLEDTIVKTNLDAIPEIVRQIRLRDLGGIIIIDFIDMDERKNRHKVMAVLEEELKKDRAPSKVLQFNDFGLVAITRKRVKQSLERTLSTTCAICTGTGMTKSPVTVCNEIYIEMRKMRAHLDRGDVMLRVNPEVVKQLKSPTAKWLQEMEEMVGKTILVKSDPALHPEQFDIH